MLSFVLTVPVALAWATWVKVQTIRRHFVASSQSMSRSDDLLDEQKRALEAYQVGLGGARDHAVLLRYVRLLHERFADSAPYGNRFELDHEPIYQSKTCEVFTGKDVSSEFVGQLQTNNSVVVKITCDERKHRTEVAAFQCLQLPAAHTLACGMIASGAISREDKMCRQRQQNRNVHSGTSIHGEYYIALNRGARTLADMIANDGWAARDLRRVREVFVQLCTCVTQVHQCGLVHGDLNPRNFVLFGTRLELIDFDSVAMAGEPANMNACDSVYTAPEIAR